LVNLENSPKKDVVRYRLTIVGEFEISKEEFENIKVIYDMSKNMYDILPIFRDGGEVNVSLEEIEELEKKLIE